MYTRSAQYDTVNYRAVYQFFAAFENNSNFGQKMFTSTEFRSKFVETYYLKFVKLEVARILGYIYSCVPLVPVLKYQYCCILNLVR